MEYVVLGFIFVYCYMLIYIEDKGPDYPGDSYEMSPDIGYLLGFMMVEISNFINQFCYV